MENALISINEYPLFDLHTGIQIYALMCNCAFLLGHIYSSGLSRVYLFEYIHGWLPRLLPRYVRRKRGEKSQYLGMVFESEASILVHTAEADKVINGKNLTHDGTNRTVTHPWTDIPEIPRIHSLEVLRVLLIITRDTNPSSEQSHLGRVGI